MSQFSYLQACSKNKMNRQWTRRNSAFSIKKDQHLQSQKKIGTINANNRHDLASSFNTFASHDHNLKLFDVKIAEVEPRYDPKGIHQAEQKSTQLNNIKATEIPEEYPQASKMVSQRFTAEGKGDAPLQPSIPPFFSQPLKVFQNDLDRVATSPIHMRAKVNNSWFSTFQPNKSSKPQPTQVPPFARTQFQPPNLAIKLASLSASLASARSKIHWDNACSFHVTNDINLLEQMLPIPPDTFIGVGGPGKATHVGYLPFLPAINFINIGYYAPDFPQTLLSLGQLHACGGAYASSLDPNIVEIYAIDSDPNSLLDTAPLTPGSNMLPTTIRKLATTLASMPSLSIADPSQVPPPRFPQSLRSFIIEHPHR